MCFVFGLLSSVVVLAVIGLTATKQLTAARLAIPALAVPAVQGAPALKASPEATPKAQLEQIQQQYQ